MSAWVTDPLVLARFVHFTACVLAAGTATFAILATESSAAAPAMDGLRRRWRLLVDVSAGVAALSGLAWLAVVAANIVGASIVDACLHGGLWSVASGTQFGWLAGTRVVLALLLTVPFWHDRLRVALALGLIVLIAPAGHAGAQVGPWSDVHLVADAAHLVAAGAWLGGLPALVMLLGAAYRNPATLGKDAARTTARFSRLGIACVGTLIATGVVNGWFLLSGPGDLLTTVYGRVLALKIGLFTAMVAIAAVNRFHLMPRLARSAVLRALRQNSLVELGLGIVVLFLVAVLGMLEPGGHRHENTSIPRDAAFVHIHANVAMADVTIEPGRPGRVDVRVHLSNEDFTDYAARSVHLELRPPESDLSPIGREAKTAANGVWDVSGLELRRPGIWTVVLTVKPERGPIVVLDGPIVIARQEQE